MLLQKLFLNLTYSISLFGVIAVHRTHGNSLTGDKRSADFAYVTTCWHIALLGTLQRSVTVKLKNSCYIIHVILHLCDMTICKICERRKHKQRLATRRYRLKQRRTKCSVKKNKTNNN